MSSELKAPIRLDLIHSMLSFCSVLPRNIEEICAEHHIHRETFHTYQHILDNTRLLTELAEPPEGKGGTRARWFSTSPQGEELVRRLRSATALLSPYYGIIEGADLLEEKTPPVELTCSICGRPIAHLSPNSTCEACGFDFPVLPVEGLNVLFAKTLEIHASKLDETQSFIATISMELVEERKHSAELQREVERLYEKLGEMTESVDDVRALIKTLQPLVKQVKG